MKRSIFVAVVALFFASAAFADYDWKTEGVKTNPSANTLLADSGNLVAGDHHLYFVASATVLTTMKIQHLDTDGSTVLDEQLVKVLADNNFTWDAWVTVANANEKVRVIVNAYALGTVQSSILFLK